MKSLNAQGHQLSNVLYQLQILEQASVDTKLIKRFDRSLEESGLFPLKPLEMEILQVNLGKCAIKCVRIAMWMPGRTAKRS